MTTGHRYSSKRVLTPIHYKKTLNQRIQPHCASTRRQREQGGRAPYQSRRSIFGKGRPSRTSIFCTASLPPAPLTTLCGDFPPSPRGRVQKDPKPRREREGAGSASRRSHATLAARGGTTLSRLRRNAGKEERALTPAHTHTPGRAARPHPPSTPSAEAGPERLGRAVATSQRVGGAAQGAQLSPARPPGPATPSPAATRPSRRRMPPYSPHISPSLDAPHALPSAPSQDGRSPGTGRESTEFNDTLGFLFSPFCP